MRKRVNEQQDEIYELYELQDRLEQYTRKNSVSTVFCGEFIRKNWVIYFGVTYKDVDRFRKGRSTNYSAWKPAR